MCVCVRTHTHRWVCVVCTTSQERVARFLFFLWTFVLEAIPVPILRGHCFCRYAWLIAAASQPPTERGVACLHLPGWRAQSSPTVATRASPQPGVQIPAGITRSKGRLASSAAGIPHAPTCAELSKSLSVLVLMPPWFEEGDARCWKACLNYHHWWDAGTQLWGFGFLLFLSFCILWKLLYFPKICVSIWYEFILLEYDGLFLTFMLILSRLRNGVCFWYIIGIFYQDCINIHLKNVNMFNRRQMTSFFLRKGYKVKHIWNAHFPWFWYSVRVCIWIQHLLHWIFLHFPVKEACFCIFCSHLDHCFFRIKMVLGISTLGVWFDWYPMNIFLIVLDWNSFPVCVAGWAPD